MADEITVKQFVNTALEGLGGDINSANNTLTQQAKNITKLEENSSEISDNLKRMTFPKCEKKAILTIIDDDCNKGFFDLWDKVCDEKKINITLAIVTKWLTSGESNAMTKEQLKGLIDKGYDFVSHTYNHSYAVFKSSSTDLTTVADDAIIEEYSKSQDDLKELGLEYACDTVVYPWGQFNSKYAGQEERYTNLAKKYFSYGINATSSGLNDTPNNSIYLNRLFITDSNIDTVKSQIDSAISGKKWFILGTHSNKTDFTIDTITQIIEYAQEQGIEIMTFHDALKYKKNIASIGRYNTPNSLYIGANGEIRKSVGVLYDINSNLVENKDFHSAVSEVNGIVTGTVALVNYAKTFTWTAGAVATKIKNITPPAKSMPMFATVYRADNTIAQVPVEVKKASDGNVAITFTLADSVATRFIFINFQYAVN